MTLSQRAMVAAKLATLSDGQRSDLVEGGSIDLASKLLNVSPKSVKRAIGQEEAATLGQHGGDRRSEQARDQVDNINLKTQGGTSSNYTLARLRRDRPDLDALERSEQTAMWERLMLRRQERDQVAQLAHPDKPGRYEKRGTAQASRDLGLDRVRTSPQSHA
jgi:hypothetical protein